MDDFNLSLHLYLIFLRIITKLFLGFLQYFKGRKCCGKKMLGKSIVAIEISQLLPFFLPVAIGFPGLWRHLLSATFNVIKKLFFSFIFSNKLRYQLVFALFISHFFSFLSCGNKLQDFLFHQVNFQKIFLSFQELAALNSLDILIFEFL